MNQSDAGELPISSVLSSARFPDRSVIKVREAASALGVTSAQIIGLIEAGELAAINIGSKRGQAAQSRVHYRIPVSAFAAFIKTRQS